VNHSPEAVNFAKLYDLQHREQQERIREALEFMGLSRDGGRLVGDYSGGMVRRLEIAQSTLHRPRVLFLDEPTSGLDPGNETAFMYLMRHLADQGRTIIMVTHTTKNVMLADKVIFMNSGGYLAWFGPPDEALPYFSQYRHEDEKLNQFDDIYAQLDDCEMGCSEDWADRFRASAAYQKYIEERLFSAYSRIRRNARNGLAVVKIERDACGGCFNKIPPQRQMEIQMHKKIFVCEYCGRILIDEEIAEAIKSKA